MAQFYGLPTKIKKVTAKPQHPINIQQAIKILQKLALNGRAPITLKVDIYSSEQIDITLLGLPLVDDDFIET